MFCPDINGECKGEICRNWNEKTGRCRLLDQVQATEDLAENYRKFVEVYQGLIDMQNLTNLWMRVVLRQVLDDPTMPAESKEAINKALQAPSAEVAEQLLREQGMID